MRFFIFFLLTLSCVCADFPWPDKSGPNKDGHVGAAHVKGVVTSWDEASGKHIAWKTALPEEGHSTPVIDTTSLWFTSASKDGTKQYVDVVDRKTGELIHHHLVFENEDPEPLGNGVNNYAAPSCVIDNTGLYVHFGTYGTTKLNPKTLEKLWERRDINARHFRGPGSSPVLYKDRLILTMDGIDQQYVAALNKNTGKTIWKTNRTTDYGDLDKDGKPEREGDNRKAYGTPSIVSVAGKDQLISVGSRAMFGYDPETGKELWTIPHANFNAAVRPVSRDGMLFVNTGSSRAHLLAIRLDDKMQGDINNSHVVWDRAKRNSRFSGHVLVNDRIIQSTEGGIVSSIDQKSGKQIWSDRLPGTYMATPIVVGDLVYYANETGQSRVIKVLGDKMEIVGEGELEVGIQASAVVADGALFFRTKTMLYKLAP
ncbi:MAG: PQQ-binding-like beta-propeller repeat protein [Verrucomicrobiales bacterium]|nr:PQQ-binding-like beta-propeller repeat protein [Verrucomicrobiales bacterium]